MSPSKIFVRKHKPGSRPITAKDNPTSAECIRESRKIRDVLFVAIGAASVGTVRHAEISNRCVYLVSVLILIFIIHDQ